MLLFTGKGANEFKEWQQDLAVVFSRLTGSFLKFSFLALYQTNIHNP